MKRQAISKRVRFEVFKRDSFTCQYCGEAPPAVVLHIDHINPVADGGGNDMDNLVTACNTCNLGKSDIPLTSVPQSLKEKAANIAEREDQLRGYYAVIEAKRERVEEEIWRVAEVLDPGCSEKGFRKDYLASIRMFIEKLGLHPVLDLAEISAVAKPYSTKSRFLYFCGCCWNRAREE